MPDSEFRTLYVQLVSLLESTQTPYFIVGGLATGVLGEPRLTHDVDVIVSVTETTLAPFLQAARTELSAQLTEELRPMLRASAHKQD